MPVAPTVLLIHAKGLEMETGDSPAPSAPSGTRVGTGPVEANGRHEAGPEPSDVTVTVAIDTEEDDWGRYDERRPATRNIAHLPELQDLFDRWDVRPTYLVNRPPLVSHESVETLGRLAGHASVEIGAHCHPWNTPPLGDEGAHRSMMSSFSREENRAKLGEIRRCLTSELGVDPKVFRAGRWGFGPTVAQALVDLGFELDSSVTPLIDWSAESGTDYSHAPRRPYRFDPDSPLRPSPSGALIELPTSIGYLAGDHDSRQRTRRRLERSVLRHLKVIGLLDRSGWLARRWLCPETASGETMVRLARALVASGESFLQLTFHSCALLPGATPFVRDEHDRSRFLRSVDVLLGHCHQAGFVFRTLSEAGHHFDLQHS